MAEVLVQDVPRRASAILLDGRCVARAGWVEELGEVFVAWVCTDTEAKHDYISRLET